MPRRGPPHSFGWMKLESGRGTRLETTLGFDCVNFDLWEMPEGGQVALVKGVWLELEGEFFNAVSAPPDAKVFPRHA